MTMLQCWLLLLSSRHKHHLTYLLQCSSSGGWWAARWYSATWAHIVALAASSLQRTTWGLSWWGTTTRTIGRLQTVDCTRLRRRCLATAITMATFYINYLRYWAWKILFLRKINADLLTPSSLLCFSCRTWTYCLRLIGRPHWLILLLLHPDKQIKTAVKEKNIIFALLSKSMTYATKFLTKSLIIQY